MSENQYKKTNYIPILLAITLIIGITTGFFLPRGNENAENSNIISFESNNKLNVLLDLIERNYVDTIRKKDLIEQSIPMVLKNLDPHSIYIPARDYHELNDPLEGNFEGIGIQFNLHNDTILVVATISGGPSEKAGLLAGDRIVKIEDSLFVGKKITTDDVVRNLKGQKGTKVKVSIKRRGVSELIDFEITRDKIPLYSVDISYMITDDIGFIKISKFARTTYQEFVEGIKKLQKQGMKKLIVDLRGNGGGYLQAATQIADEFLEKDKMIVYTKGRARSKNIYKASNRNLCVNFPVAVLIDAWSASASEILAGAIQDNDRGTIIGQRSFGKGLVQEPIIFADQSAIRLTIARYYTPTGRCIQKPYEDFDSYESDILNRYAHGEFIEKDSIKLPDSLKYQTPNGKIVYGGGGIMPDIFVPDDTTGYTDFLRKVRTKGLIYSFAMKYADENRQKLKKYTTNDNLINYLNAQNLLNQFANYLKQKELKDEKNELKISKNIINNQLFAYICKNVFDKEFYYPIIHKTDNTLNKAIEVLK